MMRKYVIALFALFLTGCVMTPDNATNDDGGPETYPVRYDRQHRIQEGGNDYGRELQKKELSTNDSGSYTDPTTTATAEKISERLMDNRDIVLAEVHGMEDKVYVAVKLRENNHDRTHRKDIIPYIEESVRHVLGGDDRQIIVWTDHIEWNEFKNEEAAPDTIQNFNSFFD